MQTPTMLSCKQGAVGRGPSCEGPSAAKLWAQCKGGQRCPEVLSCPGQAGSPHPSVPVGLQEPAHAVALPPPQHREVPGLLCCSGIHWKKMIQEVLLQGQILLPFPWGQSAAVALSGQLDPALLSPSGSSCVSSESMISQVPEQLDVGGSLLPP